VHLTVSTPCHSLAYGSGVYDVQLQLRKGAKPSLRLWAWPAFQRTTDYSRKACCVIERNRASCVHNAAEEDAGFLSEVASLYESFAYSLM